MAPSDVAGLHFSPPAARSSMHHILPRNLSSTSASSAPASSSSSSGLCFDLANDHIIISKKTLIIAITIILFITLLTTLGLAILLYREWTRRQQKQAAKVWGRKSRVEQRISLMRKEIDAQYSRQYSGCLAQEPENPEMGSDSPVEIMFPERLCEAPAVPARAAGPRRERRKSRGISLFFSEGLGVWLPKGR